jgi:DNA-binding phage protein
MTVQKTITLSKFDAADYLDSRETIIAYLNEALEFGMRISFTMRSKPSLGPKA